MIVGRRTREGDDERETQEACRLLLLMRTRSLSPQESLQSPAPAAPSFPLPSPSAPLPSSPSVMLLEELADCVLVPR